MSDRYTDYEVDIAAGFILLLYDLIDNSHTQNMVISVMNPICSIV